MHSCWVGNAATFKTFVAFFISSVLIAGAPLKTQVKTEYCRYCRCTWGLIDFRGTGVTSVADAFDYWIVHSCHLLKKLRLLTTNRAGQHTMDCLNEHSLLKSDGYVFILHMHVSLVFLIVITPCDTRWERTALSTVPQLSDLNNEIKSHISAFVPYYLNRISIGQKAVVIIWMI